MYLVDRIIVWICKVASCTLLGARRREYIRKGLLVLGSDSGGYPTIYRHDTETCKVIVGSKVSIGPEVVFIPGMIHDRSDGYNWKPVKTHRPLSRGDIVIGDDVWLCGRCTILSGVKIGRGAIVAAGSVVSRNVPAYTLVGGVPAEVIVKWNGPNVVS